VAQKWADQCASVDYKGDKVRKDPLLFHDPHAHRKIGEMEGNVSHKIKTLRLCKKEKKKDLILILNLALL